MRNEKGKNILLGVLIVGLVSMTVAFAALSSQLNIAGTAEVKGGTWGVQFEEVTGGATQINDSVVGGTPGASFASGITLSATSIQGVKVTFTKPGTEAIYNFKIHNTGTINAKISSISPNAGTLTIVSAATDESKKTADENLVRAGLTYYVEYESATDTWTPIAVGDTLNAGDSINARLRLVYADANSIPSADVTVTGLDRQIIYSQN